MAYDPDHLYVLMTKELMHLELGRDAASPEAKLVHSRLAAYYSYMVERMRAEANGIRREG